MAATETDVLELARHWLADGHGVALATVVKTSGSAPRQTGSHIAVRDDGLFAGSVSAGCIEGAIIEEALAAMKDGRHRTLTFGVSEDGVFDTGLLCGGQIDILVEPIN
jgi:xanthine dehydrogenase accessory factor